MEYTVERTFNSIYVTCLEWTYQNFDDALKGLICEMKDRIGHPFIGDLYRNLKFVMNPPLYDEFYRLCKMTNHNPNMYRNIQIITDSSLYIGDTNKSPDGIVRLIYEEGSETEYFHSYCVNDAKAIYEFYESFIGLDRGHGFKRLPHIDHVIFNGPATIVFWKDGTKTVVKYDGKGRKDKKQAILYAFIRKIYGEGRAYHDILNEIEEAIY